MQTVTAIVSNYETTNTSAEYNINGTYQNNAALIGFIASVLALPVAAASSVVSLILSSLGIIGSFADLVISDYYVDCVKRSSFWKTQDAGYPSAISYTDGIQYEVHYRGNTTRPTTGQYFPRSNFAARSIALANELYYGLWAHPNYTVVW